MATPGDFEGVYDHYRGGTLYVCASCGHTTKDESGSYCVACGLKFLGEEDTGIYEALTDDMILEYIKEKQDKDNLTDDEIRILSIYMYIADQRGL